MVFLVGTAIAVSPAGAAPPWTYVDRTHGLAGNSVRAIAGDGSGGLWIGTDGGLSHYDGARWETFTTAQGLPDNDVRSLHLGHDGRLWVGVGRGIGLYAQGRWARLGLPVAEAVGRRVAVVGDRDGATWFGYTGGLSRFDPVTGTLVQVEEFTGKDVDALLVGGDGTLWAGSSAGLFRREGTTWKRVVEASGGPRGRVSALLEDSRGVLWCGREDGLAEFDGVRWRAHDQRDGLPPAAVAALAEDRHGRIWAGTDKGAGFYDGYEWLWMNVEAGLPDMAVLALGTDPNGSIWIGTARGLARFDVTWSTLGPPGPKETPPTGPLGVGGDGAWYAATDGGFIEYRGRKVERFGEREGLPGRATAFLANADGSLWIGTARGLHLFDGRVRKSHHPPAAVEKSEMNEAQTRITYWQERTYDRNSGLKSDNVTALCGDGDEGLWVGTDQGLSRFTGDEWVLLEEQPAVGRGQITALLRAPDGSVWAGTSDGLWLIDPEGKTTRFGREQGLPGSVITALLLDRDGRLWVGTDRGLARRDPKEWAIFTQADGLAGNRVLSLLADSSGRLWVGTDGGLTLHHQGLWSSFGEGDGLHAARVTSLAEVGGSLLVGSEKGVSPLHPDRSPPDTAFARIPPPVVGTSYTLFDVTGSDLETPVHQLRYSWRLDDEPWSAFHPDPVITVTDLANGRHTLHVRSVDRTLNIDVSPASFAFEVNTSLFDVELIRTEFSPIHAALYQYYAGGIDPAARAVGSVTLRNRYDRPLKVKLSLFLSGLMDFPTDRIVTLAAGETRAVPLRIELGQEVMELGETVTRQVRLSLQYNLQGELKESSLTFPVTIVERHGMTWSDPRQIALYVTHLDAAVEHFARETLRRLKEVEREAIIYDHLLRAMALFDALGAHGVRYLPDPDHPYSGLTAGKEVLDYIRFPRETLVGKTGDCDDVAVLYAALLQNIGIDTAVVDAGDHVLVLFDTGLRERLARQVSRERGLLHVDDEGRVWIPVEVTMLGKPFSEAWRTGGEILRSRKHAIIDVADAWETYPPVVPPSAPALVEPPSPETLAVLLDRDMRLQEEALTTPAVQELKKQVTEHPDDARAHNALGILLAESGYLSQASRHFTRVTELAGKAPGGWSNLANVLYEQGRYEQAVEHYILSLKRKEVPQVLVELALTLCEVGRFEEARRHFGRAMALEPALGDSFRKLAAGGE